MENISVLIPTCGRLQLLARCLSSLKKQTVLPSQIVVIDNSSTLGTEKIVENFKKHFQIVYAVEEEKGEAFARNKALELARGDILVFIDDDCVAGRKWLEKILSHFKEYPESDGLVGKSENLLKGNPFAQVFQSYYWRWLMENFENLDQVQILKLRNSFFDTKNLALRKNIVKNFSFDKNVLFHGVNVDSIAGDEFIKLGNFYYHPHVIVYHQNPMSLRDLLKKNYYQGIADQWILEKQKINNRKHVLSCSFFTWLEKCRLESKNLSLINKIVFWITLIAYPLPYKIGRISYRLKLYR